MITGSDAATPVVVTPIIVTEQASHRILVLDPNGDWSSERAVLWSWKPGPESGIRDHIGSWGLPNDARLRKDSSTGQQFVMVSDSNGLLAAVRFPQGGQLAWSADVGHAANPHGIERLPNGNVAAAASTGGWVRVYAASQGRRSDVYAEERLPGAHEVLWSIELRMLWAVGDDLLVKYDVGGTSAAPTLLRLASFALPTSGGHDLQPVSGEPGALWVTTVSGVYRFDVTAEEFTVVYPRQPELDRADVKSVGTDGRSGAILQTTPKAGNPCSWCTDEVLVFVGTRGRMAKTLPGAEIYRARWFDEQGN